MLSQGTIRLAPGHPRHTIRGVPTTPVPCTSCKQTKSVRGTNSQRRYLTCKVLPQPLATLMEQHADHHAQETPASWASLLITCGLMFVGAYGCGMLPRWLPNQQRLSSSVSTLRQGAPLCSILGLPPDAAAPGLTSRTCILRMSCRIEQLKQHPSLSVFLVYASLAMRHAWQPDKSPALPPLPKHHHPHPQNPSTPPSQPNPQQLIMHA